MFTRTCLGLLLLLSTYAVCQVGNETATTTAAETPMTTPPPVSGAAYSTAFASDTQTNFLRTGITLSTAYSNNIQSGGALISDMSYSLWPTIAFDSTTTRLHWVLNYSPGFTFYQRASNLNQSDQNVAFDFQYHLSPHVTATLRDSFQKTWIPSISQIRSSPRLSPVQRHRRMSGLSLPLPTSCRIRPVPSSPTNSERTAWSA